MLQRVWPGEDARFQEDFYFFFLQQEERRHNARIIYIATGKYICSFPVQFRLIVSAAVIPRSAPVAVHLQGKGTEMLGVANFYPGSGLLLVAQLCSVWPCRLIIYLPWLDPAALLRCANVVRPLLSVIVCVFISCEMQRYGRWSNTSTL